MASTTKIFKSDPIWHSNGKFRINLIQFKSSLHGQSVAIKSDFTRVARALCNESQSEILAFPRTMPFQAKSQHQAQHGQIILITSQFCDWQYVLNCLDKNGMELSNDDYNSEMNARLLQNALKFAIDAKLSPLWNKMSRYMVRHPDFLTRGFVEAVKTELRVSENLDHYQAYLNLEGVVLKWTRQVTLQTLKIEERFRGMFVRKEVDVISQQHLSNQWLCVLPNLTKARLRSVTRFITKGKHGLDTKEDMRQYWKSLYGYELPDNFGQVYCNVTFGRSDNIFGTDEFCYPIECLRLEEPNEITRSSMALGDDLVTAFIEDLRESFPQICQSHPFKFPKVGQETIISQNLQQSFGLHQSTISRFFNASKDGDKTGLTSSSGDHSKKDNAGLEKLKQRLQSKCNDEQTNIIGDESHKEISKEPHQDFARESGTPAISHFFNASRDGDRIGLTNSYGKFGNTQHNTYPSLAGSTPQNCQSAFISSNGDNEEEVPNQISGIIPSQVENIIKFKPTFGKKNTSMNQNFQSSFGSTNQSLNEEDSSLNSSDTGFGSLPSQIQNIVKFKPTFTARKVGNANINQNYQSSSLESISQLTDPDNSDNSLDSSSQRSNNSILPSQIENIIKAKPVFVKKVLPSKEAQVPNFSTNMKQKLQEFQRVFSQEIPTVEQASNFTFKKPAGVPKKKSGTGGKSDLMTQMLKRKPGDEDVISIPAKKIKAEEDIPGFAAAGCLHKKSTVSGLKTWLNSVGIRTKAKEKKEELVRKALEKLGYSTVTAELEQ